MKKESIKKGRKVRDVVIFFAMIFAVGTVGFIAFGEFYSDPTLTQVYFKFENGTSKWVDSDTLITHQFKNGTVVKMKVIDLAPIVNPEDFIAKTIHLKDGTIDYHYKHFDAIGSKTP